MPCQLPRGYRGSFRPDAPAVILQHTAKLQQRSVRSTELRENKTRPSDDRKRHEQRQIYAYKTVRLRLKAALTHLEKLLDFWIGSTGSSPLNI